MGSYPTFAASMGFGAGSSGTGGANRRHRMARRERHLEREYGVSLLATSMVIRSRWAIHMPRCVRCLGFRVGPSF